MLPLRDTASLEQPQTGGGVAFFAHTGGFVFGALAVRAFAPERPRQAIG